MNNKDKYKNDKNENFTENKKDESFSKNDKKEFYNLQKRNVFLENEIKKMRSELENKNIEINNLSKKLEDFNLNYKSDILKKTHEAQATLDLKIKEYQDKFEKDILHIKKYCLKDKMPELIDVISNFESALNSKPSDQVIQNYLKGFEMFLAMLKNYLANNNVSEIPIKVGDKFDEKIMEPLDVEENSSFMTNQVIKVLKPGYFLYDLVIKPAIVIIAK